MPSTSRITNGYAAAVMSAMVLSTTSVMIRHLTRTYALPALVLAFWRDLFMVTSLLIGLILLRPALMRLKKRQAGFVLGYGLVLALFNATWTLSVAINGAAIATVMAYCSVAFTALLSPWLLKERQGGTRWLVVALSLVGCVMVSGAVSAATGSSRMGGIVTGVLSGISYALYTIFGRAAAKKGLHPWTSLLYSFGVATVFLLGFNLLPGGIVPGAAVQPAELFWLGNEWLGWCVLILLAAGPTLAGFGLYTLSLTYLPAGVVNLIAISEPVFTAVIAFFLLNERLNWFQAAGGALILGAVVLMRLQENRGNGLEADASSPPPA